MSLFLWILIFIVSLAVLVKSSDYFTEAAEKIGLYLGLPAFIVGVTILAVGTSLPELISAIMAVIKNSSEMVVGNVVGSNIANILLVLGLTGIIGKTINIDYELIRVDLPLLVGSAFLLTGTVWDGSFNFYEALICLAGVIVYILYITSEGQDSIKIKKAKENKKKAKEKEFDWSNLFILVGSGVFIYLGANFTVESVIKISEILNIGTEIIAVSAVALGTSLPELMVTISASKKGNQEIAVGNVLGSNIFNSLAVMGVPGLIGTLTIPQSILSFGLPVMLMATLLYFFITQDKEITRWEGWLLLIFYIFFIGKTFGLF